MDRTNMEQKKQYARVEMPHADRLPLVVLVNGNGHRDTLSQGAEVEFVFAAGRAVRVKLGMRDGEPCVRVSEVREGELVVDRDDDGGLVVMSEGECKTQGARHKG